MKYIKTLHLLNIQSHKETILHLSEGLNVIKGTSHHGKSSLIRGIEWLLFNRPLAPQDKIKSWFAKPTEEMSVTMEMETGGWVSRTHSKEFNGYIVGNEEGQELYEALRGEVPEEVRWALGLDEINFRGQHEGYFMFSLGSGEVAKLFNQAAGLHTISQVESRINSLSRATSDELGKVEAQIKDESAARDRLLFVRNIESDMQRLEMRVGRCTTLEKNIDAIALAVYNIGLLQETIDRAFKKITLKSDAQSLSQLISKYEEVQRKYIPLNQSVVRLKTNETEVQELKAWLEVKSATTKLRSFISDYDNKSTKRTALASAYATIQKLEIKRSTLSQHVAQLKEKRNTLHAKLDYCPECGAHRDHWKIENGN